MTEVDKPPVPRHAAARVVPRGRPRPPAYAPERILRAIRQAIARSRRAG